MWVFLFIASNWIQVHGLCFAFIVLLVSGLTGHVILLHTCTLEYRYVIVMGGV